MSKINIDKFIESWMELMHETGLNDTAFRQMKETLQKQGLTFKDGKIVKGKNKAEILSDKDYICLKNLGNGKFTKDVVYHSTQDGCLVDNNGTHHLITLWTEYFKEVNPSDGHKFNIGDWVVYDGWITMITGVYEDGYTNRNHGFIKKECEKEMRLLGVDDVIYIDEKYDNDDYNARWLMIVKSVDKDGHLLTIFSNEIIGNKVYYGKDGEYWGYLNDLGEKSSIRIAYPNEVDILFNKIKSNNLLWDGEYYVKSQITSDAGTTKKVNWYDSDYDYAWKAIQFLDACQRESSSKREYKTAYDYKTIEDWVRGLIRRVKIEK